MPDALVAFCGWLGSAGTSVVCCGWLDSAGTSVDGWAWVSAGTSVDGWAWVVSAGTSVDGWAWVASAGTSVDGWAWVDSAGTSVTCCGSLESVGIVFGATASAPVLSAMERENKSFPGLVGGAPESTKRGKKGLWGGEEEGEERNGFQKNVCVRIESNGWIAPY